MINFNVGLDVIPKQFDIEFHTNTVSFTPSLDVNISVNDPGQVDKYDGDYEITPLNIDQTVPTRSKYMTDDITVKSVPYFEVENLSKGKTLIIGG